jgi:hypothetical protein
MRHVAEFWRANEFRPETKTRTLPTIDANPESENRQSVCRRSAKKPDPPHGQETHRLAQTKPTVSTQSRCGPIAILLSCHFPLAPKLGRRAPIAKFTYCRHSRKIPARSSDRRAAQKINQLPSPVSTKFNWGVTARNGLSRRLVYAGSGNSRPPARRGNSRGAPRRGYF